jgi:hypothetical protein
MLLLAAPLADVEIDDQRSDRSADHERCEIEGRDHARGRVGQEPELMRWNGTGNGPTDWPFRM